MEHQVVNGVRLACRVEGHGPPLLLLHGLGGSHDDWRRQVPVFARRYRVIAPDLRGFGDSERQEPFTVQQHARDVAGLLDALGVARAHVVGLSMGGAVAMELALSEPGRVAGLVLANTAPGFELHGWQRRYMGFSRLLLALLFGVGGVARFFSKHGLSGAAPGEPAQAAARARQPHQPLGLHRLAALAGPLACGRSAPFPALADPGDRRGARLHRHPRKTPLGREDPGRAGRDAAGQPPPLRAGRAGRLQRRRGPFPRRRAGAMTGMLGEHSIRPRHARSAPLPGAS